MKFVSIEVWDVFDLQLIDVFKRYIVWITREMNIVTAVKHVIGNHDCVVYGISINVFKEEGGFGHTVCGGITLLSFHFEIVIRLNDGT